jgi:large subunit ribosomal protein L25
MPTKTRPRLTAEPRTGVRKKSALRHIRKAGLIPALVYGHGEPQAIQLDAKMVQDYLSHHAPGAILDLHLSGSPTPVLIRELDRHPVNSHLVHLGFQRVDLQEIVRAAVPIVIHGEDVLIENNLVFERQMDELEVHARAELLPESIVVDVAGMEAGQSLRIADLPLPQGVEASKDPDAMVARVTLPTVDAAVAAALDAEEAAHEAYEEGTEEEKEMESDTEEMAQTQE